MQQLIAYSSSKNELNRIKDYTTIKPKLVNLSSKEINEQAKQVLLKYGLKLTPVPRMNDNSNEVIKY